MAPWLVLVRSETRLPRLKRLREERRDKSVEQRRDCSTKRESSTSTPMTRERRDPTSALERSQKLLE
jgi:hypothetical protein